MTKWKLIGSLLAGVKIYWRNLLVFLLIAIVSIGGYIIWKNQSSTQAAFDFPDVANYSLVEKQVVDIYVQENGRITVGNKNYSGSLKILPNYYEISILILDSPGVYISNFSVLMHLPKPVKPSQIEQIVYAVHGIENYQTKFIDSQTLLYVAENISPESSLTVVAHLPKDSLVPPEDKQITYILAQIPAKSYLVLAIFLPVLTMIIMIFMIARRRQDQIFYTSRKITNQPPNNSPPAVVGALKDSRVGAREIAATLIDLAVRGYLFINRRADGTFSFGKRKSLSLEKLPELREYERILLTKIFEPDQYKSTNEDVEMRIGRHIFSRKIANVYLNIYNEAMKLGYFVQNPVKVHLRWRFTGIGLFFLGLIGFFYTAFWAPDPKYFLLLWVGEIVAGSVVVWLSGLMPTRSVTGTTTLRQWLQFYQYLKTNKPIEGGASITDTFNRFLPYAIVFGVEVEWARRFFNQNFAKPDWYESEAPVVTLEVFVGELFPLITFVGGSLDKSHDPTVE